MTYQSKLKSVARSIFVVGGDQSRLTPKKTRAVIRPPRLWTRPWDNMQIPTRMVMIGNQIDGRKRLRSTLDGISNNA